MRIQIGMGREPRDTTDDGMLVCDECNWWGYGASRWLLDQGDYVDVGWRCPACGDFIPDEDER